MTLINELSLAELYYMMIKEPDLTENEILYYYNEHIGIPISLRTLQRIKHQLRNMSCSERRMTLYRYYDFGLKAKLYDLSKSTLSYPDFCDKLGVICVNYKLFYPYLPRRQVQKMEKFKRETNEFVDRTQKWIKRFNKKHNETNK